MLVADSVTGSALEDADAAHAGGQGLLSGSTVAVRVACAGLLREDGDVVDGVVQLARASEAIESTARPFMATQPSEALAHSASTNEWHRCLR